MELFWTVNQNRLDNRNKHLSVQRNTDSGPRRKECQVPGPGCRMMKFPGTMKGMKLNVTIG